jgi:C-terminal processing protease CtpA/Prc
VQKLEKLNNRFLAKSIVKFNFSIVIIGFILSLSSCSKDDVYPISEDTRSINNFIWENMDLYYLWRDFMPSNIDPNLQPDPKEYFNRLIYTQDDRWSYITDDYQGLVDRLQGISKTYGHEFKLFKKSDSKQVYGIVEYVIKDSPAKSKGIERGDVFNRINGVLLDTLNYYHLLFSNEGYAIGFADLIDGEVVSNDREVFITPIVMQEDPILLDTTYYVEGKKIGYLVYNRFLSSFEQDLNTVFAQFKMNGVSDLVLDLRYNPGGSVGNATLLASLIAPSNIVSNEEVFVKYIWNDIINQYWRDKEGDESENLIIRFEDAAQNININRIYVIVSGSSASASEMIINGLKPYMEVVLIGETTHGKYTASITLHDEEKSFNWAIQPIVLKTANSNGETDYKDGLIPDYLVEDDYFAALGSLDEARLAYAISLITGIPIDPVARRGINEIILQSIPMISGGVTTREDNIVLDADNVTIY